MGSGDSRRVQIIETHSHLSNVTSSALSHDAHHIRGGGYFLYLPQLIHCTYLYLCIERHFLDDLCKHIEPQTCFPEVLVAIFHFCDQIQIKS